MAEPIPSEKPVCLTSSPSKTNQLTVPQDKPSPESPTTARPMDFDDEAQETGIVSPDGHQTPTRPPRTSSQQRNVRFDEEEAPPAKPPRPNPQHQAQQAEATLIEAFPDTDPKVVKAVLVASGFKVEPAFNALLGTSSCRVHDHVTVEADER